MAKRLLRQQIELIEYLTSGAGIFGSTTQHARVPDGFDERLLQVEAWLSHEKRLTKIRAVFAKTFEIIGASGGELVRDFAESTPPASGGRLANARQFHSFLTSRWWHRSPDPPYLRDVAAVELARAEAVACADVERRLVVGPTEGVRRASGVQLLRCGYDVRPVFEAGAADEKPTKQDTRLAVVLPPGMSRPQVLRLTPAVFDLLSLLDDVTDLTMFGPASEIQSLIDELAGFDLVERHRCG